MAPGFSRAFRPLGAGLDAAVPTGVDDAATYLPDVKMSPAGATGPLAIGQKFGPRYQIIRLLGIGGMGAVYQAWDAELDVVVALKVIRPEATTDPDDARGIERRFKQELLLARQVTHKNVVRIHDLGETLMYAGSLDPGDRDRRRVGTRASAPRITLKIGLTASKLRGNLAAGWSLPGNGT